MSSLCYNIFIYHKYSDLQFLNVSLGKLRMDFLAKKYRIEKYVLNLDLQSLDADIEYFKNKILPQIQEVKRTIIPRQRK